MIASLYCTRGTGGRGLAGTVPLQSFGLQYTEKVHTNTKRRKNKMFLNYVSER